MRVSRLALVPLFVIVLAFAAGMLLSGGNDSTDPPPAAAEQLAAPLPPAAQESLAEPAGFFYPPDICDYVAYLHFVIIAGIPHAPYISLGEFIYLTALCFGPFEADSVHAAGSAIPVDITASGAGNFVDVSGTYDPTTGTFEGTGTGTVAGYPNISVELILNFEGNEVTGTYTMGAANELPGNYPAVYEIDGELSSTPTPGPSGTPGPTITRPPTETPGPSATPEPGSSRLWGDLDCDGEISSRDNQALLRKVLDQAALSQTPPCDAIGTDVFIQVGDVVLQDPFTWGNLDCDVDGITSRDNQALLRNVLTQAALSQTEFCPDIGTEVGIISLASVN